MKLTFIIINLKKLPTRASLIIVGKVASLKLHPNYRLGGLISRVEKYLLLFPQVRIIAFEITEKIFLREARSLLIPRSDPNLCKLGKSETAKPRKETVSQARKKIFHETSVPRRRGDVERV